MSALLEDARLPLNMTTVSATARATAMTPRRVAPPRQRARFPPHSAHWDGIALDPQATGVALPNLVSGDAYWVMLECENVRGMVRSPMVGPIVPRGASCVERLDCIVLCCEARPHSHELVALPGCFHRAGLL